MGLIRSPGKGSRDRPCDMVWPLLMCKGLWELWFGVSAEAGTDRDMNNVCAVISFLYFR